MNIGDAEVGADAQVAEALVAVAKIFEERGFPKEKNLNVVHFTPYELGYLKIVHDGFLRSFANKSEKYDGVLGCILGQQVLHD